MARPRHTDSFIRSSSSCLSLLSESDFLDEPSTSGCSSEMASMAQCREKKRQKVREFLKELKSMVPQNQGTKKLGTLSTLDYVVSSMRKITEEQKQDKVQVFQTPSSDLVALPHCSESVDFQNVIDGIPLSTQSDLLVAVSLKNHVVLHASTPLMDLLGYPPAWWKGRLLKDFIHKKDLMTVTSYINSESSETESVPESGSPKQRVTKQDTQQTKNIFYARIRRFRSLSTGFSIQGAASYTFFKIMVSSKLPENVPEFSSEEQKISKRFLMLYFAPMTSPYKDGQLPPEHEQQTFSMRHSLFCQYTHIHANTVALLGFLPQDIIGSSIFESYHPDDLPQLLDIYKKVMQSMGQPFKTGSLRMRTRNGTFLKVTTEWSSFTNPWDHKLEFIIAQHTVIKPPDNCNVLEDCVEDRKLTDVKQLESNKKIISKIIEILKKPMTINYPEDKPSAPPDPGIAATCGQSACVTPPNRDTELGGKGNSREKAKNESSAGQTSASDISSSIMDEKSISSLYNQLNYSLNIKKFLLSHPKCFPVSDEDSNTEVVAKDDSEEDMNEEEEMAVEIPVVRPPSCGSSTQVHVSDQGKDEEIPSPPSFSDESHPTREAADNQLVLTEESLRKHTKAQERLYLQRASKEQPYLFHMRPCRRGGRVRQKRGRPVTHEETDVFKFARTSMGQRGANPNSGSGMFISNVPMTSVDIKPTTTPQVAASIHQQQSNVVGMMPGHYQSGMGVMPQLTMVPVDPATGVHLQPAIQPFIPNPASSMQWPYYPQSAGVCVLPAGYSLLPQVMAGFYQPMLQPVPMTTVSQPAFSPGCSPGSFAVTPMTGMQQKSHQSSKLPQRSEQICRCEHSCQNQGKAFGAYTHSWLENYQKQDNQKDQVKSGTDSDNHTSSMEDTSSSTRYLLDAVSALNSSPNEDVEEKIAQYQRHLSKHQRPAVPPWLQGINWTAELRMKYKLPILKRKNVLKKDREVLKKMLQSTENQQQLEELLEDIDMHNYTTAIDEEADFIFYPDPKTDDMVDGDRTPCGNGSPVVSWNIGIPEKEEAIIADDHVDNEKSMEDVINSNNVEKLSNNVEKNCLDKLEKITEDLGATLVTLTESMEKSHSPCSQGNCTGKEGYESSSVLQPLAESKTAVGTMENNGKSPKDGSWSDEGSDNGSSNALQKAIEVEDAQSSSSKVSSDLTPSEERSMEEAGSSFKESDMSTPKGSFASSNDKMSTDSSESAPTPRADFFDKLFVSLNVWMCQGSKVFRENTVPTLPFWHLEAHMSKQVEMQYTIAPIDLPTILANDRRRLADMKQPHQVNCQLLELLQDAESQKGSAGIGEDNSKPALDKVSEYFEGGSSEIPSTFMKKMDNKASFQHMAPPCKKHSPALESLCIKSKVSLPPSESPRGKSTESKSGQTPAIVQKQLLEKLQFMTQGKQSDLWPGDIIMNKVSRPVDLGSVHSLPGALTKSQDTEILDSVD